MERRAKRFQRIRAMSAQDGRGLWMENDGARAEMLWREALRLRRRSGWGDRLPPLFFFTDPVRTPRPHEVARRLPEGCGLVYRSFGDPRALKTAGELARIARDRGLVFFVGADATLADQTEADGLHLPERLLGAARGLLAERPDRMLTVAAHSRAALRRAGRQGLDAAFVSPVFDSASASAGDPIGPRRLRRWIDGAALPVFALGGVNARTIVALRRSGAAGVAGIEAFLRA